MQQTDQPYADSYMPKSLHGTKRSVLQIKSNTSELVSEVSIHLHSTDTRQDFLQGVM